MLNVNDALFEKVFFQSAHIAILDLALREAKTDMAYALMLPEEERQAFLREALKKIEMAYKSIERLKQGEISE